MQFKWTKTGLKYMINSGDAQTFLGGLKVGLSNVAGVDAWDAAIGDITPATFTGSTPKALTSGDAPIGPFADDGLQQWYMKSLALSWSNTGATDETIYSAYLFEDASPDVLNGILVFDDPVLVAAGATISLNILYGIGQSLLDASIEVDLP